MATTSTITSFPSSPSSGGLHFKARDHGSEKSYLSGRTNCLTFQRKLNQQTSNRKLSLRAEYNDRSGGVGGEFFAGFLLGGALCGALAYIYAPQIRRSLRNEDEYGFRRPKRLVYQDDGLENARQTLNAKISQLNSAIDNVATRLKGGDSTSQVSVETDPEEAATF